MIRVTNQMASFLKIIYNNLLISDISDKIMRPPNEGACS